MVGTGISLSLLALVGILSAAVLGTYIAFRVLKGVFCIFGRVFVCAGAMVSDSLRMAGSLVAVAFYTPLVLVKILVGRWSSARHYGRALETELVAAGKALYRVAIHHPLHLLGLTSLSEGIEVRIPNAVASAPGADRPADAYIGYKVVGSLPTGGSGARLYVADPDRTKREYYRKCGLPNPGQVVIKSFELDDGSNLPQIVRESRALEAARDLGLVLDHGIDENRFFYVMPYVPGEDLGAVTARMHAEAGGGGLSTPQVRRTVDYMCDLLATLHRYHEGDLWHKDVKPDNIIISDGRAYLVDLGLVTPLRSAMTLTTHGTEYFRDPELVRQAMRGAKVNEVDGVRFDLYGAGAVLFSMIENSFPAHGSLSQVSKRCPEALNWIVRRGMADLGSRYASSQEMLADLMVVQRAPDPFALKPADLPSMGESTVRAMPPVAPPPPPSPEPQLGGPARFRPLPEAAPVALAAGAATPDPRHAWFDRKGSGEASQAAPAKKRRRHRTGPNAGVFTALLVAVLIGGALVAFGLAPSRMHMYGPGESITRSLRGAGDWVTVDSGNGSVTIKTSGAGVSALENIRHEVDSLFEEIRVEPASGESRSSRAGAPAVQAKDVLILHNAPPRFDESLAGFYNSLRERGYDLFGVHDTGAAGSHPDELEAQARYALGVADPDDPDGRARLQRFLDSREELDALLWIGRSRSESNGLRGYLISQSDVSVKELRRLLEAVEI